MAQLGGSGPVLPRYLPEALDGTLLRRWMSLAEVVAADVRDLVDYLNVFPVPDADTGTNVLLTLHAACDALTHLPRGADAAQVARAAADGAVRGARGNSGLLISQALAALADVCAEAPDPAGLRPVELVSAYERMASTTWSAISRPVPGTLLTVARDAATAARASLRESTPSTPASINSIAAAAAFGAQESVVETAGLGHGPVDAGGAALMLVLTCLSDTIESAVEASEPAPAIPLRHGWQGGAPSTAVALQMLTDLANGGLLHADAAAGSLGLDGVSTGEFEVMYLLEATAAQASMLRMDLEAIGDSVGVVGTPDALGVGLYQVHIHTDTPRAALPRQGRARQICIHRLQPTALMADTAEPPAPWAKPGAKDAGHVVSFERLAARRAERRAQSVRMHPSQASQPRPANPDAGPGGAGTAGATGGTGATSAVPGTGVVPGAAGPGGAPRGTPIQASAHKPVHAEGIGVIACTRAPGLIEQLARSGTVVVLEPDRDAIVRAAGDLAASQIIVLPCDAACTEAAHEAARVLAARSAAVDISQSAKPQRPGSGRSAGEASRSPHHVEGIQLLVCDTDDEARVLAAAIAVAGRHDDAAVAEIARRAWRAAARLRTVSLSGAEADPEAVAHTISALLRPDDELLTVITGRNASGDIGTMAAGAAAAYTRAYNYADSFSFADGLEVAIHAGGQPSPDVLIAIE